MFDIGFTELVVVGIVALIVIGPEKLPKTARTLGHLFGRLQRYISDVKADISREMELEELRKLQQQVRSAARDIETSVGAAARDFETGVRGVEKELNAAASVDAIPPPVTSPAAGDVPPAAASGATPSPAAAQAPEEQPRQASLPGFDRG